MPLTRVARRFQARSLHAGVALALLTGAAWAAPRPLAFAPPTPQVAAIVQGTYGQFLKQYAGKGRVSAVLTDTDHDGVAEVAVRFDYPFSCTGAGADRSCYTTILKHGAQGWQEEFGFHVVTLAVLPGPAKQAAPLLVNGRQVWDAMPSGGYAPNLASYARDGQVLSVSTPIVGAVQLPVQPAEYLTHDNPMPPPKVLRAAGIAGQFLRTEIDVGGSVGRLTVVTPPGITCGEGAGCRAAFYDQAGRLVLGTMLPGAFVVGAGQGADGVHDLVLSAPEGVDFYRWDAGAKRYALSATSYRSSVSAIP